MNPATRENTRRGRGTIRCACVVVCACTSAAPTSAAIAGAERPEGSIVAWGDNFYGQTNVPAPNTGFIAVAAGGYHSLGLKADGSIVAWGDGPGNPPAPNSGFIAVAAGYAHSLGLKADGSIVGWGQDLDRATDVPTPNTSFVGVAAGEFHSLGLKANGSIVAWGRNDWGQTNVPSPNTGFLAVAAGWSHSLGVKADGSIVSWGCRTVECNIFLRCWCTAPASGPPSPNTGFVSLAAGMDSSLSFASQNFFVADGFSLGLKADGSVVAWGANHWGQTNVPAPNSGFIAVAAGEFHSLAIRRMMGDADGDGDVDRADFAAFADYLFGPTVDPQLAGWRFFDVDMDSDVDLRDFAEFQTLFTPSPP